jgi:eukaryotic-like serine/threonine-protein kinase
MTAASPAFGARTDSDETPPSLEVASGSVIAGRFRLEERLGEGGMGIVWKAVHLVTRKPVALKFLRNDTDRHAIARFLREARAACAVRHPNVVEVHDVLELPDGAPVMVMELLEGESFADKLSREGKLPVSTLAEIMIQVGSAVGAAHALGIIHRDLKPENIFLSEGARGAEVKVLDFGIAKLTATDGDTAQSGATTATGAIMGTPYYMAPEQLFGEKNIDHRADLWAIGVILYEALAGRRPTQADNVGQIFKIVTKDGIVPLQELEPALPAPLLDLVGKLLQQDRARRPADLREVVAVLATFTSVEAGSFGVPRAPAETPVPGKVTISNVDSIDAHAATVDASVMRRKWPQVLVAVVAAVAVVVAASTAVFWRAGPKSLPSMASTTGSPVVAAVASPAIPPPTTSAPSAGSAIASAAASASPPGASSVDVASRVPSAASATKSATQRRATPRGSTSAAPSARPEPSALPKAPATPKMEDDL